MLNEVSQDYFYKRLGKLVKDARCEAEITQDELANYLDLSRVSIVNIEYGKQKVQIHTLMEIISYLKIDKVDFFEKLSLAMQVEVNSKIFENKLKKEVSSGNSVDLNKLKEFVNFSISKNRI